MATGNGAFVISSESVRLNWLSLSSYHVNVNNIMHVMRVIFGLLMESSLLLSGDNSSSSNINSSRFLLFDPSFGLPFFALFFVIVPLRMYN